jgi:hypothetical protein
LQAYALMATSAATGAVRDLPLVRRVDRRSRAPRPEGRGEHCCC